MVPTGANMNKSWAGGSPMEPFWLDLAFALACVAALAGVIYEAFKL
jgi:hypothetical protein